MRDLGKVCLAILASVLAGLSAAVPASASTALYGSAYTGGPGSPSTLYRISPGTGTATAIGPIGFGNVGALDFAPNATLYGVGSNTTPDQVLIRINVATGTGTQIGSLGLGLVPVTDIDFRPSDGKLFALSAPAPTILVLYTIDTSTGAATLVGIVGPGIGFPNGNALAFVGSSLYYAASAFGTSILFTLDQNTATVAFVTFLSYSAAFGSFDNRPAAMKVDPATGTLSAIVVNGFSSAVKQWSLGTIDTTTGVVTFVGPTQSRMDGIADLPAVPTLGEWGQILLAAVLGVTAVWMIRRRRERPWSVP